MQEGTVETQYLKELGHISAPSTYSPTAFTLVPRSVKSSTLKMEAAFPSEKPVDYERTIRRYVPEDSK
jgi:hypothetical protein